MTEYLRESRKNVRKRKDNSIQISGPLELEQSAATKAKNAFNDARRKGGGKDANFSRKLDITGPVNVVHKLHVDKDLNWTGKESANSLELLDKLGEGAYGAVYRALHVPTGHILAVKTVPMSGAAQETDDIKKEIEILKQCRHDNIVSLYGCMFQEGVLWILMDFCGAGSVKDFQKHWPKPLTESEITAIMYFVVLGLRYLHSINIIHRDLKSANILITENGDVKIADFGVSFQVNNTLAKANTVVGTPLFMAPEALAASNSTEKADIWSMAITAIEMVDGYPPHHDENIMRAMLLITTAEPPKLVNADKMSDKFNAFLARCLKMNADERPSAEELLEDELFKDQNHKAVMAGLLAEYRINKLVNLSSDSLSDKQATDNDDDGACQLVEEALEVFEEDPRRPVIKRTESVRSTSSNGSLGTISHGDLDKIAFINTVVKQKKQWAPDVEESINAMEELMTSLQEQLNEEKIMTAEAAFYKGVSFQKLVREINEMKVTAAELEAKVASYKRSTRKPKK
mmetsp:Transcript_12776/g.51006  ORF Transcript_12776/g.51006 Transcript_12776/m.51006 type:complete len:516 (-) Transcript_12776:40-1587(-)|eukprot:CAMPEP_0114619168 /NCGR_PEP_ID=MMETSP0168-20121206/8077_1 /TAXON_ID=95228 ORGANISM="Vannella sp., Strain DIVA3 517/6/12" /NCGR_SAMPLE_ID=MMETSP0168 /ASSEMBLY_ACC=CAM_ASM_000044 /LENGTH=515 /DNA_ID=CAMNT_0001830333 /DNA_START=115 /DNA_END=1662 /DNA_ORIENTATION=-